MAESGCTSESESQTVEGGCLKLAMDRYRKVECGGRVVFLAQIKLHTLHTTIILSKRVSLFGSSDASSIELLLLLLG